MVRVSKAGTSVERKRSGVRPVHLKVKVLGAEAPGLSSERAEHRRRQPLAPLLGQGEHREDAHPSTVHYADADRAGRTISFGESEHGAVADALQKCPVDVRVG